MKVAAILLAAGRSERFGSNKLEQSLGGRPVWRWGFEALCRHPAIDSVGIVAAPGELGSFNATACGAAFVVEGGQTRTQSVRAGIQSIGDEFDAAIIHDGARPFVSARLITDVIEGIASDGAAFPGLPVPDTIKQKQGNSFRTLDRSSLIAVQTPQGARLDLLRRAYSGGVEGTDDMQLLEAIGITPKVVPAGPNNFKITLAEDFSRAQAQVASAETRTGFGYDVHPFSDDTSRLLMVGGLAFDGYPGLAGHSDADVLLHAIADALLGAACLGDIGVHFPNDDPRWKDAASILFVRETGTLLHSHGWNIAHIDATIVAELPKVMPRREEICRNIADALRMESSQVSVKATTNEGLGSIGRGEGISAYAVATVRRVG